MSAIGTSCPLMRKHLDAYKPISVGPFVTHSGHHGPLDTSFPLEDDYTLVAELELRPHGHRRLAAESWPAIVDKGKAMDVFEAVSSRIACRHFLDQGNQRPHCLRKRGKLSVRG